MVFNEGREVSLLFWPKRALLKYLNCPHCICNIFYNIAHKIPLDVKNYVLHPSGSSTLLFTLRYVLIMLQMEFHVKLPKSCFIAFYERFYITDFAVSNRAWFLYNPLKKATDYSVLSV